MTISQQPRSVIRRISHKVSTKDGWLGEYDYGWLCLPSLPFSKKSHEPPFYALDAELPLLLAMASGLQHALAMLAGLITPPIIFASALNLDPATSSYMISASLIGCGILSVVQISRIRLFGGYFLGTGLISVVGTSFSTLSTANAIFDAMYRDGTCSSTTNADGTATRNACPDAYGKLLGQWIYASCLWLNPSAGTSLICSFLEMFMAFVPPRVLKRIFTPIVTGTVVVLIGAGLIGDSGALNWGGGSNGCQDFPTSGIFQLCPTIFAPRPLPWASPEFIRLGFLSFVSIILTELFGSPFLKNISIIVGLAVGCIVAGAAGYIDGSSIHTAPAITFLWLSRLQSGYNQVLNDNPRVHTFKIGVYPPAILPMLAVYVSLAMEAIGDITASAEVSKVDVRGLEFDSRIQGGILSDGLGGFISALFTVTPLSIFAQNNGVIAITRCANRAAGRWCCTFLILFGILGKISGALLAIPNPVLGGVTTFLFATVTVSGLRVLSFNKYTRRDRFVLAAAMSFGIGDLLAPQMFTHLFDGVNNPNSALEGFFNSITIILSTPFLAAGMVAVLLNLILPIEHHEIADSADADDDGEKELGSTGGSDV
ncbi:xanthine/uracil permease [Mycena leptocephala]|nr:xanthine/uracil permease [Mycena leptocephala]